MQCFLQHYSLWLLIHFPSRRNSDQSDSPSEPTKPVLRKHGKLITFFRWETEYKSFQFFNSQELHLVTAGSWEAEKARDLAGESLRLRPRRTSSQFWQRRWIYSPPHLFLRLCLLLKSFERKKRFEVPQRAGMRKRPDLSLRTANQLSAAYRRQKKRWRRSSDRVKIEFNRASRTDVDITKRLS